MSTQDPADQITDDMVACWRVNYGLDKMTPADAMRWWAESCNGSAPAGAVAALGLCLAERGRLRAEIADALHAMRAYARDNPRHEYQGATQDPDGVHAWLARNDRA